MRRASAIAIAWSCAGALAFCACSALPEIASNVCGNAVLEPGEDCDGFALHGLACRAAGESGACHLDCSPQADGSATACPEGYGCDAQQACRKATGTLVPLPARILGNAWSLTSADFDGDGRADVLSAERAGTGGATKIRAHYFDRDGVVSHSWSSNDFMNTPTPLALPGSTRGSLAVARFGGIGVLTGEDDGALISKVLPSYILAGTQARVVGVFDEPINDSTSLVVLATHDGKRGLFRQALHNDVVELAVEVPFGAEDLAAEPVVADLFEDDTQFPCSDLVLAARGAGEVRIYSMCERAADGSVRWRAKPSVVTLSLAPRAHLTHGLVAADLDGDHHLDLLVGTDAGSYVAYGDGARFGKLQPGALFSTTGDTKLPMPLAAGDVSGDGRADLILPGAVMLNDPASPARSLRYYPNWMQVTEPWTAAAIADVNHDGMLDAVAISNRALDVSVFIGNGVPRLSLFTIPTDRPIEQLAVGDFDADLINDLALVQKAEAPNGPAEISVAFGNPSGPPSTPRVVARVPNIEQVTAFRSTSNTTVSFLGLFYEQTSRDGTTGSSLAFLTGNTDRNLPCVVELSRFSADGSLGSATSLAVTTGTFTTRGESDVLALALDRASLPTLTYQLWLLRDVASGRTDLTALGWSFVPDLQPLVDFDTSPKVTATLTAGDLDGDHLDELVLAAPDGTRTRCLLSSARITLSGTPRAQVSKPVVLEETCEEDTQLAVFDVDGDGDRDVVILLGPPSGPRKRLALWGDGTGELDASTLSSLTPKTARPTAFALLPRSAGGVTRIAYTSSDAVHLLRARSDPRHFDDAGVLTKLTHGTGIVAADVDGDGVTDLAVADDGAVRVLHAELEAQ